MTSSLFGNKLLHWHKSVERILPWKSTSDPYKIWLSEIILQQTRVAQGTPYYLKFIQLFPTVEDLAQAEEEQVLLAWQGLGYYSRARNLHFAAKTIVKEFHGKFPRQYEEIRSLKGVGEYTAAAIASFAFGLPYAVLDGNVKRVISRYFGINEPIDNPSTLKDIKTLLNEVFISKEPASFNQAIMDFGALHCKPKAPKCLECVFNTTCAAFKEGMVDQIPFKAKKIKKRNRFFHYFILGNEQILIKKRTSGDIWEGLFDFPLLEKEVDSDLTKAEQSNFLKQLNIDDVDISECRIIIQCKHVLTHQNLFIKIYKVETNKLPHNNGAYLKVLKSDLTKYAFPIVLSPEKMIEKDESII